MEDLNLVSCFEGYPRGQAVQMSFLSSADFCLAIKLPCIQGIHTALLTEILQQQVGKLRATSA